MNTPVHNRTTCSLYLIILKEGKALTCLQTVHPDIVEIFEAFALSRIAAVLRLP